MTKSRKILAAVLCMCMLFATTMTAYAAEPRVLVTKCPKCIEGTVTTITKRVYEHDERFPCCHGKTGTDLYAAYEVTRTSACKNCSYKDVYVYTEHVLLNCNGH